MAALIVLYDVPSSKKTEGRNSWKVAKLLALGVLLKNTLIFKNESFFNENHVSTEFTNCNKDDLNNQK